MHTIPNCSYFQSNRKLNVGLDEKILNLQIFVEYIQINCLIVLKQRKLKYDPLHLVTLVCTAKKSECMSAVLAVPANNAGTAFNIFYSYL